MLQSNFAPLRTSPSAMPTARSRSTRKLSSTIHRSPRPVARHQVRCLFDDLLRIERVPLPPVHSVVRAVGAVIRTRETRCVHRPTPAAHAFVGVEIGQVIGLRRQLANRLEGSRRVEHDPAVFLVPDALDPLERLARFDPLYDFEQRVLTLAGDHDVDVFRGQRLVRKQRRMPAAEYDRYLRV